ncbi:MAG: hypothetical protein N2C14_00450, partial [Planctomycetales bacterium]
MGANPKKLKKTKEHGRGDILFSMAVQPGTDRLFAGSSDFRIYDFDLAAEKLEPQEMPGHESYVTGAALAGNRLASGAYDGRLIWWDADSREQIHSADAHRKWIRGVAVSADGK